MESLRPQLSTFLGFEVDEVTWDYVLSFEEFDDLMEYLGDMCEENEGLDSFCRLFLNATQAISNTPIEEVKHEEKAAASQNNEKRSKKKKKTLLLDELHALEPSFTHSTTSRQMNFISRNERPPPTSDTKDKKEGSEAPAYKRANVNRGNVCLSMWQPWASLLVYGIKKIEGRSWDTDHRGLLWIASCAKQADKGQIRCTEGEYFLRNHKETIAFPDSYPISSLLGCVEVIDVLPNSEYRKMNPQCKEENNSDFLFVCINPRILPCPLQMSGKHKLYTIPPDILQKAKAQLE